MDTYGILGGPAVLTQFEAHMHNRGKAMCLEAIYPSGSGNARAGGAKTETLSCVDRFNFGWLRSYTYADDAQPLLPAGDDSSHHFLAQQLDQQQVELRPDQLDRFRESHHRRHGAHLVELLQRG